MKYLYLGDRLTDTKWKGRPCDPVLSLTPSLVPHRRLK